MSFSSTLGLILSILYGVMLGLALQRRAQLQQLASGVFVTLLAVLLMQLTVLIPTVYSGAESVSLYLRNLSMVACSGLLLLSFVTLTLRYLARSGVRVVIVLGGGWYVVTTVLLFQLPMTTNIGRPGWYSTIFSQPEPVGIAVLAGWLVLSALLIGLILWAFARANLPEMINRIFYWVFVAPLIPTGIVMANAGGQVIREMGWLLIFVGMVGMMYGTLSHRVFDIRQSFRVLLSTIIITGLTSIVIGAALLVDRSLTPELRSVAIILVLIAITFAAIYNPLRLAVNALLGRLWDDDRTGLAAAVRQYTESVSTVVDLRELGHLVHEALRDNLRVRSGGLLIASRNADDTYNLEPLIGDSANRQPIGLMSLPKTSPIYQTLITNRNPLLQYDIEFSPAYADLPDLQRNFFKALRLAAYAPITLQNEFIGVLAVNAKTNDAPFYQHDLDLLKTMANQTGIALRNSRLVADLRRASTESQGLNNNLIKTTEQLARLDSVKTDFITIASHELRTPLAQIRGYTDILEAMNEQSMLDTEQLGGMTVNLRKATDRLERLIADMLDVSQIGLDAMDLRFSQTSLESVLRLAIEPLAESVKQRKLQLTARGLRGLPAIDADMQRLVQAFRNIVVNAVKYTPDGGRIDIVASIQKNPQSNADEICVKIADTGIGIDPRYHDLIFEKFFRVSDPGLHSTGTTKFMGAGPGLGLTIARGVVEGHGGRVIVESGGFDPEKLPGSIFYVFLPLHPPAEAKRVLPFEQSTAATIASAAVVKDAAKSAATGLSAS